MTEAVYSSENTDSERQCCGTNNWILWLFFPSPHSKAKLHIRIHFVGYFSVLFSFLGFFSWLTFTIPFAYATSMAAKILCAKTLTHWNALSSLAVLEMLRNIVGAWREDDKLVLFYIADNFHFTNDTLEKGALEGHSWHPRQAEWVVEVFCCHLPHASHSRNCLASAGRTWIWPWNGGRPSAAPVEENSNNKTHPPRPPVTYLRNGALLRWNSNVV